MSTVLVTGGAGYVGAHACKAFAAQGWRVVVYDNLSRGWRDFVRWGELIEGDVTDMGAVARALADVRPDVVAHFAALAYVEESVRDPAAYYKTNSLGAFTLLEAMRSLGLDKLVFSSTCATYGLPERLPVVEATPQRPMSPYGWSKLMTERMLIDYAAAYGLRYTGLRYFNAAGADPDGEIGERHEPETHLIPLAFRGVLDPDYVLTIFGDQHGTRDGTCLRDYVHVGDLAQAHVLAAEHLLNGGESGFFNLGSEIGATVSEVADAVERASGRSLNRRLSGPRLGDPAALVASCEKARAVLGWRPERSSIDQIMADAWAWHSRRL